MPGGRARVIAAAGGAFLLAVLWFDLMFDVQSLRSAASPEAMKQTVDSIAAYYRRVTTDARPMSYLVAAVMLLTIGAAAYRVTRERGNKIAIVALVLCLAPIVLALVRVLPNAVMLGAGEGSLEQRHALARAICVDHLASFGAIALFVGLQVIPSGR